MAKNNLALWHWHIEISSKCPLKCPRCARSEVPGDLINTELRLEFFQQHFTPEFINEHVQKITFCGDDGDPIYAHDLIPVIRYIKSIKPVEFVIVTNGSYKKKEWWDELSEVLTDIDEIHFSLDGWGDCSNNEYRINSSWESIMVGVAALRDKPVFMRWAAIGFKFNQYRLGYMKQMAKDLGFDTFQLTKSTKFGKIYPTYPVNDNLQPRDELVSMEGRFTREEVKLSDRSKQIQSAEVNSKLADQVIHDFRGKKITPLCYTGNKGMYISSVGKLYPCCWVANRYNHNNEWANLGFDLNKTTLEATLADEFWNKRFTNFEWYECNTKCNSRDDKSYYTEW